MLYLVDYVLRDYRDKEAHFYFLLCMRGYQNLARTIPWISGVVQDIVAMAVQLGTTLPEDSLKLIEEIKSESKHIDEYRSSYPINLYPSTANTSKAPLEHLVHDFKAMQDLRTREPDVPEVWRGDSLALFTTLLEGECWNAGIATHGGEDEEKVVILRELQRAFIYTSTLSKQAIEGHVSTAFIAYSVNEGARLTPSFL
jgi:hypothetical protein